MPKRGFAVGAFAGLALALVLLFSASFSPANAGLQQMLGAANAPLLPGSYASFAAGSASTSTTVMSSTTTAVKSTSTSTAGGYPAYSNNSSQNSQSNLNSPSAAANALNGANFLFGVGSSPNIYLYSPTQADHPFVPSLWLLLPLLAALVLGLVLYRAARGPKGEPVKGVSR